MYTLYTILTNIPDYDPNTKMGISFKESDWHLEKYKILHQERRHVLDKESPKQAANLALARGQMPVKCWSGQ